MADDPRPPVTVDLGHAQGIQVGQGNNQFNTFNLPARSITWPLRIGRVPAVADCRQRRQADDDLARVFLDGAWVGPAQIVSGMGGVGKTQLAAAFVREVWDWKGVELLVWVTATSRDAIVSAYAGAAAEIVGRGHSSAQDEAGRFLDWLTEARREDGRPVRWLVVLDDVQRPSDLRGLWPPTGTTGGALVTTRRRDAALTAGRRVVDVGLFTLAQSLQYLADKLAGHPVDLTAARALTVDLGQLPLALAQAATYVLDRAGPPSRITCARYRALLADRRRSLADVFPEAESLPDEHAGTIAATWSLSIEHADALAPVGLARGVLQVAALLDPNGIPVNVLSSASVRTHLASASGHAVTADDIEETIHTLHRLSLATLAAAPAAGLDESDAAVAGEGEPDALDAGLVKVHALVQRAVRESMGQQGADVARAAAGGVLEVWPSVERQVGESGAGPLLRSNADAVREHAGAALIASDIGVHPLLFRAGRSLGNSGQTDATIEYYDDQIASATALIGPDHPDTLIARRERARWQGESGDTRGAVAALRALLPDMVRVLGPDHYDTLMTRNELGWSVGDAGDVDAALEELTALVPVLVRVLGPDHYDTLLTRHDLAGTWRKAGDPARAAAAFSDVLPDCTRALGADNRLTLRVRNALALSRGEAGDPAGAWAALAELLPVRMQAMGLNDLGTLATREGLARWQAEAGDPAGAVSPLEDLVADLHRIAGPQHPQTASALEGHRHWQAQV